MDSPDGLIVPNIKNVQNMTVLDIAQEISRLMALGEQGKLGQDDITGGTFSLSNIGSVRCLILILNNRDMLLLNPMLFS